MERAIHATVDRKEIGMTPAQVHESWKRYCQEAILLRERSGLNAALDFLVGDKLNWFAKKSTNDLSFAQELPRFLSEIRTLFSEAEISKYRMSAFISADAPS